MSEAEEHHIHLVEGHIAGKAQVRLPVQSLMHVSNKVSGIAFTVCKNYLCHGMVYQKTYQFASRITCRSQYSYLYH